MLSRWQDFVGTGEFMRAVEQKIGWLRDKLRATLRGEPPQVNDVKLAVESGLEVFVREEGDAAAERAEAAWGAHPAGRTILAATRDDLQHTSPEFPAAVSAAIRSWQGDVLALVSEVGASKRAKARYLALGVNGVGVALMIVVFTQTGGLTGAEVGVAGGTAVLAQRLLEAVFGEDTVRRLTRQAKAQLDARIEGVLALELARYDRALSSTGVDASAASAVRDAVAAVHACVTDMPALAQAGSVDGLNPAAQTPALETGASEAILSGEVLDPVEEADGVRVEVPHEG
ncbi:hypothetical protein [Propioniciclava flava]